MLHAIIMAGGFGTRFWPASRAARPKQLLDLAGGRSMIQATVDRLEGLVPPERTLVITNRRLVEPIAAQLPQLARENVIGEPCRRDTAPCIALAAHLVSRRDEEAVMAVMPADHLISPAEKFREAIAAAAELVRSDPQRIVTFGIRPTFPAETFGYIERGPRLPTPTSAGIDAYRVVRFREKPRRAQAEEFLAAGSFYWNSGVFVWRAKTILEALALYEPVMAAAMARIAAAVGTSEYGQVLQREFDAIEGKSIDYAVMERHSSVVVIEAPFAWDDVGSWQALARTLPGDEAGNTVVGKHLGLRTSGSIIRTTPDHLVVTVGLSDVIVVHTPDATLVARKQDEEAIREVVKELEKRGWNEYL
jgi:mannose-1-phosphate guanylyltransferase